MLSNRVAESVRERPLENGEIRPIVGPYCACLKRREGCLWSVVVDGVTVYVLRS
jgi:hypothetical protein